MLNPIHNFLQSFLDRAWDSAFYFSETVVRNATNFNLNLKLLLENYCWANSWQSGHLDMMTIWHIFLILILVDKLMRRMR